MWKYAGVFVVALYLQLASKASAVDSCATSPAEIVDRRVDKNQLRVVSLNAEYLMYDSTIGCHESWHGCPWKTAEAALYHLERIADTLASLDADIISLNEVHSCTELGELIKRLPTGYSPYLIAGRDTYTSQNVGMLTRIDPSNNLRRTDMRENYPITNSTCNYISSGGTYGISKNYIAEISLGDDLNVAIIGVHFLARPISKDRCIKREAQATVARKLIDDLLLSGKEVIVLGDFNDFDVHPMDISSNNPISSVLNILQEGSSYPGDKMKLHNVCKDVPTSSRFSAWYDRNENCLIDSIKELSLIDHFLVSSRLLGAVKSINISHTYGPFNGTKMCIDSKDYVSDHWPVIVDFDLRNLVKASIQSSSDTTNSTIAQMLQHHIAFEKS